MIEVFCSQTVHVMYFLCVEHYTVNQTDCYQVLTNMFEVFDDRAESYTVKKKDCHFDQ